MERLQERERFRALLRQVQREHQAGVVFSEHLGARVGQLGVEIVDLIVQLVVQRDVAVLLAVVDKEEEIHQRDFVILHAPDDPPVFLAVGGVGGVEQAGLLVVEIDQLRKLAGRERVGKRVAVHGFNVCQSERGVNLLIGFEPIQQGFLALVVPARHQHGHDVLRAERFVDRLLRDLCFVLAGGVDLAVAVHIGALVGEEECAHQTDGEHRHAHIAKLYHELAPAVDRRDEVLVPCAVHGAAEDHEQAGHEGEHGEHAQADGLDQHQPHVEADAEFHEHHGRQAGDGRQTAGGDRRDRDAQRGDARFAVPGVLAFLQEAVQQDDRVVDREGQLKDHRHGVRDEGDLPEQEVRAEVQHRRRAEGDDEHRDLGVGFRGKQQHKQNHDGRDHQNDAHFRLQRGGGIAAHGRVDLHVVGGEQLPHAAERFQADGIGLLAREGDGDERIVAVTVGVDLLGCGSGFLLRAQAVSERRGGHAFQLRELIGQMLCRVERAMGNHHARGREGGGLLLHERQALTRFRRRGQILGDVVAHLHPVARKDREDGRADVQKKDQVSFVHNQGGKTHHERGGIVLFTHSLPPSVRLRAACARSNAWCILPARRCR